MATMLISFNGTLSFGQFLGDTIVSIKVARMFAKNYPCSKILLALSRGGELNFLWQRFIDHHNVDVIFDSFHPGNADQRFSAWDRWRKDRQIEGKPFDIYKELYRRIDGGRRQGVLCGGERGLGRKNIFEYLYYGQEDKPETCTGGQEFGSDLIYYKLSPIQRAVYIAPAAKCQGNREDQFSFKFWDTVVRKLVASGVTVTVNHNGEFCEDLKGQFYRRIFPPFRHLPEEVCRHKLVACGNTGIGWMAGATGTPLLAMQPADSNMQDYRYEWCGVKSLVEFLENPDAEYCVRRIIEELDRSTVITTGCYDVLHAGHIRHLEESRSLGTKLVVALNSDASIKQLKGESRPIHSEQERKTVLEAIRFVDEVRIFDEKDAMLLIEEIRPDVITNGCDHKLEEIVGKDLVESYGGKVVVTSGTRTQSSTKSIAKLSVKPKEVTPADISAAIQIAQNISPNPPAKLRFMAAEFQSVMHLPGDVVDLGCYKGGCSLILRRMAPGKVLHVFDTGSGTPIDDPLCHHKKGEWAADFDDVKRLVGTDSKTHYHKGIFPATASDLKDRQFAFVFVDMDTYQSTMAAIEFFWPRMVPGGKMVLDDYAWIPCSGVEQAVKDKFDAKQLLIKPEVHACVVVK